MARLAILAVVVTTFIFASPATAQSTDGADAETTVPQPAGQSQYQYDADGPSIQQSVEQGIEDAVEDAQENNAAVDGTEAYIESLSPEKAEAEASEAEASEAEDPETENSETEASEAASSETEASASARYEHLPDTGGSPLSLPLAGALVAFLAGGWLMRRVHTKPG